MMSEPPIYGFIFNRIPRHLFQLLAFSPTLKNRGIPNFARGSIIRELRQKMSEKQYANPNIRGAVVVLMDNSGKAALHAAMAIIKRRVRGPALPRMKKSGTSTR